jgi:hypothetical protein
MLSESGAFARHADRHPSIVGVLRFMEYGHLREGYVRDVSKIFADAASRLLDALPDDQELAIALRKLREAKDSAVGLAVHQAFGPERQTNIIKP